MHISAGHDPYTEKMYREATKSSLTSKVAIFLSIVAILFSAYSIYSATKWQEKQISLLEQICNNTKCEQKKTP